MNSINLTRLGMEAWRIVEYANFFTDLSQQGLFLERIEFDQCYFRKQHGEPLQYQIIYSRENCNLENIQYYENQGWHYIGYYSAHLLKKDCYLVFSAPCNVKKNTLYDDKEFFLQDMKKSIRNWVILVFLSITFFIFFILWFYSPFNSREAISSIVLLFLSIIGFNLLGLFFLVRNVVSVVYFKKNKYYELNWKKQKLISLMYRIFFIILACAYCINTIYIYRY